MKGPWPPKGLSAACRGQVAACDYSGAVKHWREGLSRPQTSSFHKRLSFCSLVHSCIGLGLSVRFILGAALRRPFAERCHRGAVGGRGARQSGFAIWIRKNRRDVADFLKICL